MQNRRLVAVGASFAGLACARAAAARGVPTTVLETRSEAGLGIRTTGILVKEAADLLDVPRHLVRKLAKVRLYSPSQVFIDLERPGYTFLATDTPGLMRWCAREAERHGVEIRWGSKFRGATRVTADAITLEDNGLDCGFLVGADGARSRVARAFGLGRNTRFLSGIEAECSEPGGLADDRLHVFLDSELAKGYIGWVVPGVGITQIGLACCKPVRPDLDRFIARLSTVFDTGNPQITGHRAGLIPVGGPVSPNAGGSVMLIGDAAGWVSPLTAGGIHCALQWGRATGIAITDHLLDGAPHPARILRRQAPSFGCKRWLRRIYDMAPPNRLYNAMIGRPALAKLAQLVFSTTVGFSAERRWSIGCGSGGIRLGPES